MVTSCSYVVVTGVDGHQRNRLIAAVRGARGTSRRSTNKFSSVEISSWEDTGRSGSRNTARTTAWASMGSGLPRGAR